MKPLPIILFFGCLAAVAQNITLIGPLTVGSFTSVDADGGSGDIPAGTLLSEDFEGTPSGWTTGGTVDLDGTGVVLDGSQSALINGTGGASYAYKAFTANGAIDIFYDYQMTTGGGGLYASTQIGAGGTTRGTVYINTDKKFHVLASGGTAATASAALTSGVHYRVWVSYTKGTGANAVLSLTYGTNDVRADAIQTISSSNGTGTDDMTRLTIYAQNLLGETYYDRVRVDPQ